MSYNLTPPNNPLPPDLPQPTADGFVDGYLSRYTPQTQDPDAGTSTRGSSSAPGSTLIPCHAPHVAEERLTLAVLAPTLACRPYADRVGDRAFAIAKSSVQDPGRSTG